MMRNTSIAMIMALVSLCLSQVAQAQAPEFDTAAIDRSVITYMRANEVPGVVIGVVVGDSVVYTKGFGVADASSGAPMHVNSIFQIASVTKLFTASLMVAPSGSWISQHIHQDCPRILSTVAIGQIAQR